MSLSDHEKKLLSTTELLVLRYLVRGLQSKEIAECLGRSKPTVEGYIRVLFIKLNARSRPQLVANAIFAGVIASEDSEVIQASVTFAD